MNSKIINRFIFLITSLGFSLSMIVGIQYSCSGPEMLPDYFASPFVFKRTSLGSSMEFFYSVFGVVANWFCWTLTLYLILFLYSKLMKSYENSIVLKWISRSIRIISLTFSLLSVSISTLEMGRGFDSHSNNWHFDIEQEAKDWGSTFKANFYSLF
jgi:hypothetical protein